MEQRKSWKKILGAAGLSVLLWAAAVPKVSSEPGRAETSLEIVARTQSTPERVASFLRSHLVFQDDRLLFGQADYWQSPEEMLARGRGDCEDYALLACNLLSRQGKRAFVFSLYGEGGYAHTVCVFLEDGHYNVLNQDRLVRVRASTLEELAQKIYPGWKWGAVAQRQGHRGRAVRLITR